MAFLVAPIRTENRNSDPVKSARAKAKVEEKLQVQQQATQPAASSVSPTTQQAPKGLASGMLFRDRLTQNRANDSMVEVRKPASQKLKEARTLYDTYIQSDEYRQNLAAADQKARMDRWMTATITGSSDTIMQPIKDQKEQELKALVDHYTAQVQQEESRALMDADLQELEGWSEEERQQLKQYALDLQSDYWNSLNPMLDSFMPVAERNAAELIQKYGLGTVRNLATSYNRQANAETQGGVQAVGSEFAQEHPVLAFGAARGANLLNGIVGIPTAVQALSQKGQYPTLDTNTIGNIFGNFAGAVDQQNVESILGENGGGLRQAGAYLYQGASTGADSLLRSLTMGPMGGALAAASGSFNSAVNEASARGAKPGEALLYGAAVAGAEYYSEKIPLDNLADAMKSGGHSAADIVKNALVQAGVEATTEEASLIASLAADALILREKAEYRQTVNGLMAEGMSIEEARKQADRQVWQEVLDTGIVSALSGGMSEAGASVVGNVMAPAANVQQNPQIAADNAAPAKAEPEAAVTPEEAAEQLGRESPKAESVQKTEGELGIDRAYEATVGIEQQKTAAPEEATVTVRSAGVSPLDREVDPENDQKVLAHQLATNMNTIQDMESVSQLTGREFGKTDDNKKISDKLRDFFKSIGNKVARSGFGEVELGEYAVGAFLTHRPINRARAVSVAAAPDVIKNGRQIGYEANWKGRGYPSYVFAAPVDIAGTKVYVAAVVNKAPDNKFYLSEMIDSDGNYVRIEESPSGNSKNGLPMGLENQQGRDYARPEELSKGSSPSAEAEPMPLSKNIVPQQMQEVNGNIDESRAQGVDGQEQSMEGGQAGIKGTGAAEANFSGKAAYQDLLTEDNAQPDRPGDVRPMEVPKKDSYDRNVSEFTANAYGAAVTSDRMANEIEQLIQDGALGFDRRSNRESLENAYDAIYGTESKTGRGEAGTLKDIRKNIYDGKVRDGDIERAMLLYAKHAGKDGKRSQEYSAELMVDLATMANMTGRNLQLFKLLRRMTPEGQLMAVQKNVQQYVGSLNEGRSGKKQAAVEIPQELEKAFLTATTDADREAAADAIYKSAAAQIQPTLGEMWDAWRNLAMLGNPKTHFRNIGGSLAFRPYVSVKRAIGAAFESQFMDQQNRTKAVLGGSQEARALLSWAKQDAGSKAAMDAMDFSGTTGNEARNAIEDARQILPGKLDDIRKKNMERMEGADMKFKQREYAYSLASFLKARGYSAADIQANNVPDKVLQQGREQAVKEAQKATFNDRNKFSDAISKFRVKGNDPWSKAINVMAKGIMPFTRTPANIVVRAKEYSPLELARGFVNLSKDVKNGKADVSTSIDQIASGLTGTGAMLLGAALAGGLIPNVRLVGKIEDEDEKREGAQEYSIQIGDNYYGISWLAPANIPLFIGANVYSSLTSKAEAEELDAWDVISSLAETSSDALDPMLELSCLSSLVDAIENASYEESGGDMFLSLMASAATSYFAQGLPTIFGQAEQATETTKSSVYSSADNPVQQAFERTVGNATKRIPGVDLYQTDKLDEFGSVVQNEGGFLRRAADAFFNPFTKSEAKNDTLTQEISRLHDVQPDKVTPPDTPKTISYTDANGERISGHRLTEEEYNTLATVQGQTAKGILDKVLESDTYAAMTDQQKASVFEYVYDYAREKGRTAALEGYEGLDGWMESIEGKEAGAILDKAVKNAFTDAFDRIATDPEGAAAALDQAYELLDPHGLTEWAKEAGGRTKYFVEAKRRGVDAATFAGLYQQFRDIDQNPDYNTGDKAAEWSYQLQKAQEAGTITRQQKDALKDSMVYYQMFPAETAKFDQMTEAGISADKAMDIGQLLDGIKPQEGYTNVRDVQKASALAGSSLSRSEKTAAMKIYLSDAQDENLDLMLGLGYGPEDYAAVYEIYSGESGKGKKARTISKIQNELGVDYGTAREIYEIYG